jgi:hypothetical protein
MSARPNWCAQLERVLVRIQLWSPWVFRISFSLISLEISPIPILHIDRHKRGVLENIINTLSFPWRDPERISSAGKPENLINWDGNYLIPSLPPSWLPVWLALWSAKPKILLWINDGSKSVSSPNTRSPTLGLLHQSISQEDRKGRGETMVKRKKRILQLEAGA